MKIEKFILGTIIFFFSVVSHADSFSSNKTGGVLLASISMTVGTPTCWLNNSGSQVINFNNVTVDELKSGTINKSAGVVLSCDSIPASVTLVISPTNGKVDNIHSPGIIDGTLDGTGYKLIWASGSSIGIIGSTVEYNKSLIVKPSPQNNININVIPVMTKPGKILSGQSSASVNLTLTYV